MKHSHTEKSSLYETNSGSVHLETLILEVGFTNIIY